MTASLSQACPPPRPDGVCPCSLYQDTVTPGAPDFNDGVPLTLGVRFVWPGEPRQGAIPRLRQSSPHQRPRCPWGNRHRFAGDGVEAEEADVQESPSCDGDALTQADDVAIAAMRGHRHLLASVGRLGEFAASDRVAL